MAMTRRHLLTFFSIAGVGATVVPGRWVESLIYSLLRPAHAQATLPDSFVGIDIPADYINQLTPNPLDFLIAKAHAKHIPIPNPWNILATRNGENTYRIEIMDRGAKAIRTGSFNIDGSKGSFERDAERSCKKLEGRMDKGSILDVSPEGMTFQASYRDSLYIGAAKLNWYLVPGNDPFPGTDCT